MTQPLRMKLTGAAAREWLAAECDLVVHPRDLQQCTVVSVVLGRARLVTIEHSRAEFAHPAQPSDGARRIVIVFSRPLDFAPDAHAATRADERAWHCAHVVSGASPYRWRTDATARDLIVSVPVTANLRAVLPWRSTVERAQAVDRMLRPLAAFAALLTEEWFTLDAGTTLACDRILQDTVDTVLSHEHIERLLHERRMHTAQSRGCTATSHLMKERSTWSRF